jgi:hypothetical protein
VLSVVSEQKGKFYTGEQRKLCKIFCFLNNEAKIVRLKLFVLLKKGGCGRTEASQTIPSPARKLLSTA